MNPNLLSFRSGGTVHSHGKKNSTESSFMARVFNRDRRLRVFCLGVLAALVPSPLPADTVTDWNAIMETTVSPANPFFQTRSAAIVQVAVFEAVNAITHDYEPYIGGIRASKGSSPDAAAVAAAYRTLATLYPASVANLDAARASSLAGIPDGKAKEEGLAIGEAAASAVLQLRADDGSSAVVPYTRAPAPGVWQPTPPAYAAALLMGWGAVEPFSLAKARQFRAPPPPAISSRKFARDYAEVKDVGHVDSSSRSSHRTNLARFYAAVSPVPLYNSAARQVSAAQEHSLSENARTFALLNIALCDALISSMEAKYHYASWRPVTAIRAGDTDNNEGTAPDPTWLPLITTPPFPSYPSNHATASGAARAVLERIYGEEDFSVTLSTAALAGVQLHYTSWEQIADDVDDARIYGGIHFRFEQEAGARQGRRVGHSILRHEMRPRHRRHCD